MAVDPAPVAVDPLVASGSGPANRAEVVELASSPGSAGRPARPVSRVFGIASIVRSTKVNSEEREVEMRKNYLMLIESLERFAKEQEQETSVKFYPDMQIVVVKSQDPAALALMAEVIEAMKANAASH